MRFGSALIFLILCFALSCKKDDTFTGSTILVIKANDVTGITPDGAVFHGEIVSTPGPIDDVGFLWSTDSDPILQNSDKISLGGRTGIGTFDASVDRDLQEGLLHYVRAYARIQNTTYIGNVVSFVSLGSKAPKITDFTPKSGVYSDTITITGTNFSNVLYKNTVAFNGMWGAVVSCSETSIKVLVAPGLQDSLSVLSVTVAGNISVATDKFRLYLPSIDHLDKTEFRMCDTLNMTLSHLPKDVNPGQLLVYFNETQAAPFSKEGDRYKVKVPPMSPSETNTVTLRLWYNNQLTTSSLSLNYLRPTFLSISPEEPAILDTVTVTLGNMGTCAYNVHLGGMPVTKFAVTTSSFKMIIPVSANYSSLYLAVDINEVVVLQKYLLRKLTINSISPATGTFDDVITINGVGFIPDINSNEVCFNCSYNQPAQVLTATRTQLTVKLPRELNAQDGEVIVKVANGYLSATAPTSFKLKAPIISSISPSVITNNTPITITGENFNPEPSYNYLYNDHAYYPIQASSATPTSLTFQPTKEFLALSNDLNMSADYTANLTLSISTQQVSQTTPVKYIGPWEQVSFLSASARKSGVMLSLNNKIYSGLDGTLSYPSTPFSDFWEYDPAAKLWTQLPDFPGTPRMNAVTWELNGYGYMAFGQDAGLNYLIDVWRFDPNNKTWTQLADFPHTPVYNGGAAVFNGVAYVAAGADKEFWTFSSSEVWTQKNDLPYYFKGILAGGSLYSVMSTNFFDSKMLKYSTANDSWTLFPLQAYDNYQFVSNDGVAYYVLVSYYGSIGQLNESGPYWTSMFAPTELFPAQTYPKVGFANGKLYFLSLTNLLYELDPTL